MDDLRHDPEPELMTLADVAGFWRCSTRKARRRLERVGLPAAVTFEDDTRLLWVRSEIVAWTLRNRRHPVELEGAGAVDVAGAGRARGPQRRAA